MNSWPRLPASSGSGPRREPSAAGFSTVPRAGVVDDVPQEHAGGRCDDDGGHAVAGIGVFLSLGILIVRRPTKVGCPGMDCTRGLPRQALLGGQRGRVLRCRRRVGDGRNRHERRAIDHVTRRRCDRGTVFSSPSRVRIPISPAGIESGVGSRPLPFGSVGRPPRALPRADGARVEGAAVKTLVPGGTIGAIEFEGADGAVSITSGPGSGAIVTALAPGATSRADASIEVAATAEDVVTVPISPAGGVACAGDGLTHPSKSPRQPRMS